MLESGEGWRLGGTTEAERGWRSAARNQPALVEHDDLIRRSERRLVMRHQHDGGVALAHEPAEDGMLEQPRRDVRIDCREGIVEQRQRAVLDEARAREAHPSLLAAAQVDALLAQLLRLAAGKAGHVRPQRARRDHLI